LISLKAFSCSSSHTKPSQFSPLCGFIEGVVRDPDSAETWGLGARMEQIAKPVMLLGQVKAEVFDGVLANLGFFPRNFVSFLL
jgi:hypothetical protein